MIESYPEMEESFWEKIKLYCYWQSFQKGKVIVVDGIVVGSALSLLVEDFAFKTRSYKAITGNLLLNSQSWWRSSIRNWRFINPKYRGLRLGRRLYDVRKELCEQLNLKSIILREEFELR
jgi:hypothetical protein